MPITTVTPLACSGCGNETYGPSSDYLAECTTCGYEVDARDMQLDEGEAIAWTEDGRMGLTTTTTNESE